MSCREWTDGFRFLAMLEFLLCKKHGNRQLWFDFFLLFFYRPHFSVASTEDFGFVHTFGQSGRGFVGAVSLGAEGELKTLASDWNVVPEAADFCIVDVLVAHSPARNPPAV